MCMVGSTLQGSYSGMYQIKRYIQLRTRVIQHKKTTKYIIIILRDSGISVETNNLTFRTDAFGLNSVINVCSP